MIGSSIMSRVSATMTRSRLITKTRSRNRRRLRCPRSLRSLQAPYDLLILPLMSLLEPLIPGIPHGRLYPGPARHAVPDSPGS